METLFNDTTQTYSTEHYLKKSKIWLERAYFDDQVTWGPPPHTPSYVMRREDLGTALDRVAKRGGITVLRMITYRRDPSSTNLEHRILRQTIFDDNYVEELTYTISHSNWMLNMAGIESAAVVGQHDRDTPTTSPAVRTYQGLDNLRRRVDVDSYFSLLRYLIVFSQHGSSSNNLVEKRVFKYLQAIRADLLDCDPWTNIFQSTFIPFEDDNTKIDTIGCLAGGNRLTKHVSDGNGFTLLEDAGCGDGFTALTGPPVTIKGCRCTGAYCQSCLEKWVRGERPTCPECRKPLLLSTELRWVRSKSGCGISPRRHQQQQNRDAARRLH